MADEAEEWHVPRLCIVLFRFPGVKGAHDAVRDAKAEGWHHDEVEADALVSHEANGKVHVHDPGAAVAGGTFGVAAATILGLVGGPWVLLAMVAAGGILGGLVGHFAGRIIPADDLARVGEAIPRDSSAYVVLVEEHDVARVQEVFAARAAGVLTFPVRAEVDGLHGGEVLEKLRAGA
ncbi:MAG TPA: DUF1269 domain-containing protein [Longimicrobiaceae bacterium]|jgi:uncharacterized membrane protein